MPRPDRVVPLEDHLSARIVDGLDEIPVADRADTYAVSLWLQDEDDDPRVPVITIGHATEGHIAAVLADPHRRPSDEHEARWNYAFWPQNELAVFGGRDEPEGAALIDEWIRANGWWFESDDFSDAAFALGEMITRELVETLIGVVERLHADGAVAASIGHPVPLLIHELEYDEAIAAQNERANPADLAGPFCAWVRSC